MDYAQRIQARIEKLSVDNDEERRERQRVIRELRHELKEVQQRIPTWDRIIFFSDTPDEALEDQLQQKLEAQERALNDYFDDVEGRLQSISEEFPPFAFAVSLENCLRSSRTGQLVKLTNKKKGRGQKLEVVLKDLAQQVLDIYLPDFDIEKVDALQSKKRCESLAVNADEEFLRENDRLGYHPTTMDRVLPQCAKALLASDYFELKQDYRDLLREENRLLKDYETAQDQVSLLDKLNVFSKSKDQKEASERHKDYQALHRKRRAVYEELRQELHQALSIFPPLDLYQSLLETAAITDLLRPEEEETIHSSGQIIHEPVDRYGALQILSFNQLMTTFSETFPELQLPDSLCFRVEEVGPFPKSIEMLIDQIDRSVIPNDCEEALEYFSLLGQLGPQIEESSDKSSLLDRLIFFSETEDQRELEELSQRRKWNQRFVSSIWEGMLDEVGALAQSLGPFRLRDGCLDAIHSIAKIHTQSRRSSFRIDCKVYGQEEALSILYDIRDIFRQDFFMRGRRDALLAEVYELLRASPEAYSRPERRRRFIRMPYENFVTELANELSDSPYCELYERSRALTEKLSILKDQKEDAEEDVSLWDRINIFTSSAEEDLRDDLKALIAFENDELHSTLNQLNGVFNQAVQIYPAAQHYFDLQSVIVAVRGIRAICQSYRVTVGTGDSRRRETRYRCVLRGHDGAKNTMRHWASEFSCRFGHLPGYQQVLETWAMLKFER